MLLSLLFFRGRAALLPLVVGVTTVLGTFLVLTGRQPGLRPQLFALNLVIGLGLGLAIDYTLFLVTRFREELGHGAEPRAAVRATMAHRRAHRRLLGRHRRRRARTLTVFPLGFAQSMGIAGASVAVVAAIASLADLARAVRDLGRASCCAAATRRRGRAGPLVPPRARGHAPARAIVAVTTAAVMLASRCPRSA